MRLRACIVGSFLILLGACGSSGDQSAGGEIDRYLAAVKSGDGSIIGQLRSGTLPSGGGPSVQATTNGAVLPGGSNLLSVSSSSAIDHVVVGVQGASGYYELVGLTSATAQSVLVTLAQAAPASFALLLGGGSGTTMGGSTTVPVALTSVGTGDVQVNITWDVDSDVDLHVMDPSGEEVYWGNPTSASGGELDLDSNAACALDHKRAENITWPAGKAPSGTYRWAVDYWDSCGQAQTRYVLTINVKGKPPISGVNLADGAGDRGGACLVPNGLACGREEGSFEVP